jgi:hypothetical protein
MHCRYRRILERVMAEPLAQGRDDPAMVPVGQGEEDRLQLFTATASAQEFVQKRRVQAARRGVAST